MLESIEASLSDLVSITLTNHKAIWLWNVSSGLKVKSIQPPPASTTQFIFTDLAFLSRWLSVFS